MGLIRSGHDRDLRVDFFRGLALWWIFVDHIPGDVLANYSLHDVALCDAAEMFVLLAGFAAAKAYAGAMDRQGWLYGAAAALKRAGTLYIAHIFLFVVYAAQVSYSAAALGRSYYLGDAQLDMLAGAPYRALLQALTLRYQPNLLNILPLYVALLLLFVPAMRLLHRPRLLLALSFGLYVAARRWDLNLPGWKETGWYFDPFAWQFLFLIGAVLAHAPPKLPRDARPFDVLAEIVLGCGVFLIWVVWPHPSLVTWLPIPVAHMLLWMSKTMLDPGRLLSILALLWLTVRLVSVDAAWLRSRPAALLVLLGQHSLPVFFFSILLGFLGRLSLHADDGALMQVAVNAAGALAMLAVAGIAAWYRQRGQVQRAPAAVAAGGIGTAEAQGSADLALAPAEPPASMRCACRRVSPAGG